MAIVDEMAGFVERSAYDDLSKEAVEHLKIRMLDSLGCAIGALGAAPVRLVKEQVDDFGGAGHAALIGGGRTAADRAALYNSALVRYLDFNDSYLAKNETCHPSDNLGAVLAACEYSGADGKELLAALAVAYQVQCRLSDAAPVRSRGFDHTTQGSYAVAAGVSKALRLDTGRTANAISICGTAFNALRVTRTGALSNWKGLAYPNTAFCCVHGAFLAMRGITGPKEVFEGNKGFMDAISGPFVIDWAKEGLDRVSKTIIKKYNAEIHSQSVLEGVLELKDEYGFTAADVANVAIGIFDVAYNIIGGGEEGDKTVVRTKEEADHSLQYMVAAALLDGKVTPEQYAVERIVRDDVQRLLKKVTVRPEEAFTGRFPDEHACRVAVTLTDGRRLTREKKDYEGFHTRHMGWAAVERKFASLSRPFIDDRKIKDITGAVKGIEHIKVSELMNALSFKP